MRRRDLIAFAAGTAACWPLAARAQKAKAVVGWLGGGSPGTSAPFAAAFRQGLSDMGYVEGRNLTIESHYADGHYDRLAAMAADLAAAKVDVIAAVGGEVTMRAAVKAAPTTPIVFFADMDPVAAGYVASLSHPGGNLTGISIQEFELVPKRLELLIELVPRARVIGLLVTSAETHEKALWGPEVERAARTKGVQIPIVEASTAGEIDAAFASLAGLHADALIIGGGPFLNSRRKQTVALTLRYDMPTIFPTATFIADGGLISYAASFVVGLRQVGVYVGRVLNGEKPADLPVQQPTRYDLWINLKTAKALGLAVPPTLLAQADKVIE